MKIYLGPAGIGGVKEAVSNLNELSKLGLKCAEIAFTYGVYIKNNKDAEEIGKEADKLGFKLSIHAPYYINLNSKEKIKIEQSKKRILDCCEKAHYLKASPIVFHAAYYMEKSEEETYQAVKREIKEMQEYIKKKAWKVELAPETTGKLSQFGRVEELLRLNKEIGCSFCIDAAHLYAINQGRIDYKELLDKFKGFESLHFHFSGINYGKKGERNHVNMGKPDFRGLAKEILKRKINAVIISESPITWKDSLKQKEIFERLGYKFD